MEACKNGVPKHPEVRFVDFRFLSGMKRPTPRLLHSRNANSLLMRSDTGAYPMFRHVNLSLVAWAMPKYKRLAGHRTRASIFLETISRKTPYLFAHWRKSTVGAFA
jgi:hypothetical protein